MSCTTADLDAHKAYCNELRLLTERLMQTAGIIDDGLFHAINAYEREPELLKRIEELDELKAPPGRLTAKQRVVLQAIDDFTKKNKYAPTVRELCRIVGLKSASTMQRHLESLRKRGAITWDPYATRTIRVLVDVT